MERAKLIEEAIRLVWESLESHLLYTYEKDSAGHKFHREAVQQYARIITILTKLY